MPMSRRPRPTPEAICHWCEQTINNSPYRTPVADVIGGRWVVCSPTCPERPEGVLVFTDWKVAK